MARRRHVSVEPRANGRWAVQTDGTRRADSVHEKKADAIARGRDLAANKHTELVIKNAAGRIAAKDSHGNDPRRIEGQFSGGARPSVKPRQPIPPAGEPPRKKRGK